MTRFHVRALDARAIVGALALGHAQDRLGSLHDVAAGVEVDGAGQAVAHIRAGQLLATPGRWDSAAIGALSAAGLLISLAGGAALVSRRRTHPAV